VARISLLPLRNVDGYVASAVVDMDSGMCLAQDGTGVNLDLAAAGNSEVVKSKMKTAASLKLNDKIEDILITLGKQYHLIRPLERNGQLFIYLVLDRSKSNLALARHELRAYEGELEYS